MAERGRGLAGAARRAVRSAARAVRGSRTPRPDQVASQQPPVASPEPASAPKKTSAAATKAPATQKTTAVATKAPAKKAPAKKAPAKKAPAAKKATVAAKKTPATKKATVAATKAPGTKAATTKSPAKKAATKKAAPENAATKKAAVKKPPVKKAPVKAAATTGGITASQVRALKVRENESPWTREELAGVRGELVAEVERLGAELEQSDEQIADLIRDSADGAGDDQADSGSKAFEREHEMTLANNTRHLLVQNQRALARIEDASYGTCESCGNAIGKLRLLAFPRATLCVTCKQEQERH